MDEIYQYENDVKVPYVIYADFESILNKSDKNTIHKNRACGYSYLVVHSVDQEKCQAVIYRGEDAVEHFLKNITNEVDGLMKHIENTNIPMMLSEEDELNFKQATKSFICKESWRKIRVRDHCHLTGKYRGAAHSNCNLQLQYSNQVPIFCHNLGGYDTHLIMHHLAKYKHLNLTSTPKNKEKYISFSVGSARFLDSLNFMNESLSKLMNNLTADGDEHLHYVKHHFPDPSERKLLLRKGVYPYEWVDSMDKMDYTSLPLKESFYSKLSLSHISDDDYVHAQNVWKTFNMKTMGDYHDLYLKADVLLLADCFEHFWKTCLAFYGLDPAHYFTTPGFSWDAALKMTKVNLLISYLFFFFFIIFALYIFRCQRRCQYYQHKTLQSEQQVYERLQSQFAGSFPGLLGCQILYFNF